MRSILMTLLGLAVTVSSQAEVEQMRSFSMYNYSTVIADLDSEASNTIAYLHAIKACFEVKSEVSNQMYLKDEDYAAQNSACIDIRKDTMARQMLIYAESLGMTIEAMEREMSSGRVYIMGRLIRAGTDPTAVQRRALTETMRIKKLKAGKGATIQRILSAPVEMKDYIEMKKFEMPEFEYKEKIHGEYYRKMSPQEIDAWKRKGEKK